MLFKEKKRFGDFLKEKLFLRFHMFLILVGTFLSGLLATKLLLVFNVKEMLIRYPVAIIISYLFFFVFVKLWLFYVTSRRGSEDITGDMADILNFGPDIPSGYDIPDPVVGGGGEFGGGGASGSFEVPGDTVHSTVSDSLVTATTESAGGGAADASADVAGGLLEEGGLVLIVLGALLAIVFGMGIYLIYEAPLILSEAAFEFLLAAGLIRGMKKMDNPDWVGSILRTTIWAFLLTFCIAILFAAIVNSAFPHATKLTDIIRLLLK